MYGFRLRDLRQKKGLSQDDLAAMTGLNQRQVSRYENGTNEPSGEVLVALARVLETSTDYLLGRTDDPSPYLVSSDLTAAERQAVGLWRQGDRAGAARIVLNSESA